MPGFKLGKISGNRASDDKVRTCNKDATTYSPRVAMRDMIIFLKIVFVKNESKVNPPCDAAMLWMPFTAMNNAANYEKNKPA